MSIQETFGITLNFQSVKNGLPPVENDSHGSSYSIECAAIVDNEMFDRSVKYCFDGLGGWVWADMALGHKPSDYLEELGYDNPTVSHWAPWPTFEKALTQELLDQAA